MSLENISLKSILFKIEENIPYITFPENFFDREYDFDNEIDSNQVNITFENLQNYLRENYTISISQPNIIEKFDDIITLIFNLSITLMEKDNEDILCDKKCKECTDNYDCYMLQSYIYYITSLFVNIYIENNKLDRLPTPRELINNFLEEYLSCQTLYIDNISIN